VASPIVTNTSAQLNGVQLAQSAPPITLTDAQIKLLPTTPFQILAAPGVGIRAKVLGCTIALDSAAGAYTNINTTYASLVLTHTSAADFWLAVGPVNDSTVGGPLGALTYFMGNTFNSVVECAQTGAIFDAGATSGVQLWFIASAPQGRTMFTNKAVYLSMDNNGSGALTGGNGANSMTVILYYALETLS
jgi:hypothetical protein